MERKIALFDFDKTVISKDSILILYELTKRRVPGFQRDLMGRIVKGSFLKSPKQIKRGVKEAFLNMLTYYTPNELRQSVLEDIMDHTFTEATKTIYRLKEEGYYLMLVSASVDTYLQYVGEVFPFDHIIGTTCDEHFQLVGENNRHEVKVANILSHLAEKNIAIDYDHSVAYSDSLSADRPMMELVKNRYLINSHVKPEGYVQLSWTETQNPLK